MLKIEPALLPSYLFVGALEHGEIKIILLANVIIQHPLVGAGHRSNSVNASAGEPVCRKLLFGCVQDADPHAFGIALPFQIALRLTQSRIACREMMSLATSKKIEQHRV